MKNWDPDDSRWKTKWEEVKLKNKPTDEAEPELDGINR